MNGSTSRIFVAAIAITLAGAAPALAAGAFAVGVDGDAAHGLAFGAAYNTSDARARELALKDCHKYGVDVPGAAKAAAKCQIVSSFSRQCFSFAMDPKVGTVGYGTSIGGTQEAANAQAIAACKSISPPDRQKFCVIDTSGCDANDGPPAPAAPAAAQK